MLESLGTQIEKDGLLDKYRQNELNDVLMEEWSSHTKNLLAALPYSLTPSQLNAVSEIIWDLKRPVPMNRLLQVLHYMRMLFFSYQIFISSLSIIYNEGLTLTKSMSSKLKISISDFRLKLLYIIILAMFLAINLQVLDKFFE